MKKKTSKLIIIFNKLTHALLSGADLKSSAGMKLFTGCLFEEGCVLLLGHQSDGKGQSLVGVQETRTKFGFNSSFNNRRNGYHVLPIDTETYTQILDISLDLTWKKLQSKIMQQNNMI